MRKKKEEEGNEIAENTALQSYYTNKDCFFIAKTFSNIYFITKKLFPTRISHFKYNVILHPFQNDQCFRKKFFL